MNLKKWREKNNITRVKTARLFGLSESFIKKVEDGDRVPSLKTAQRIEDITNGEITVADLVQIAGYEIRKVAQ